MWFRTKQGVGPKLARPLLIIETLSLHSHDLRLHWYGNHSPFRESHKREYSKLVSGHNFLNASQSTSVDPPTRSFELVMSNRRMYSILILQNQ
jgi:hypothetical protein